MSTETINLTEELYQYLQQVGVREHQVLKELRAATRGMPGAGMQISPEQGQFMGLLVELTGAKKTLDIGTYTGYSALAVALSLPTQGKVITCDISKESTSVAQRFWEKALVAQKVELHLAPALYTLQQLIDDGQADTFDFSFIDADKNNYDGYYEKSLVLLRRGGLIMIDNVLWGGRVVNPRDTDNDTNSIRALNKKIHRDERVTISMLPVSDGLTLARKR